MKARQVLPAKLAGFRPAIVILPHLMKEVRRKEAAKLHRVPTAGCHKQNGLKCTGCGPSTAGRATTVSMVRQRSMRRKPLYLASNLSIAGWG